MVSYAVEFSRQGGDDVKVRMATLNATNVLIASKGQQYSVTPRLDRPMCHISKSMEEEDGIAHMQALPDVTGWELQEGVTLGGHQTNVWVYERRHQSKRVLYKFYAAPDGTPLRLHMLGNDIFSGAHYDEWVVDYTLYVPGDPNPAMFEQPDACKRSDATRQTTKGLSPHALRMLASSLPAVRYGGDPGYDAFLMSAHGASRRHTSLHEYRRRQAVFSQNVAKISAHNAASQRTYRLAMNRFGDWTKEEFLAVMLPKHAQRDSAPDAAADGPNRERGRHEIEYAPLIDPRRVPASVSWQGTGADGRPRDQACCGSCWAFGASGAMEGAWWAATGRAVSLSAQQVMDCSWGFVPGHDSSTAACDGGDAWAGVGHVVDAGGIAATSDYEYLGQDNYCTENGTAKAAKFRGYARVPPYDEAALMEAVYSRGPLSISMDASQDSFTFYSSGIYQEDACLYKAKDLDHSMVLLGYGTEDGADYWLIRNSWSEHWGDGGYMKVARQSHGCGIPADAMYAVVDEEAAAAARAEQQAVSRTAGGVATV